MDVSYVTKAALYIAFLLKRKMQTYTESYKIHSLPRHMIKNVKRGNDVSKVLWVVF